MAEREWTARVSQSRKVSAVIAIPSHDARPDNTPDSISRERAWQSCWMASCFRPGSVFLLRSAHPADSLERASDLDGAHAWKHKLVGCEPSNAPAGCAGRLSLESRPSLSRVGDRCSDSLLRLQMVRGSKSPIKQSGSQISLRA